MPDIMDDLFSMPLTYRRLEEICTALSVRCPRLCVSTLAYSVCGRRIPYLHIGEGRRLVLYVAGHHASEWICGLPLLAFAQELCGICGRGTESTETKKAAATPERKPQMTARVRLRRSKTAFVPHACWSNTVS